MSLAIFCWFELFLAMSFMFEKTCFDQILVEQRKSREIEVLQKNSAISQKKNQKKFRIFEIFSEHIFKLKMGFTEIFMSVRPSSVCVPFLGRYSL
jgi:hypothetical protein